MIVLFFGFELSTPFFLFAGLAFMTATGVDAGICRSNEHLSLERQKCLQRIEDISQTALKTDFGRIRSPLGEMLLKPGLQCCFNPLASNQLRS